MAEPDLYKSVPPKKQQDYWQNGQNQLFQNSGNWSKANNLRRVVQRVQCKPFTNLQLTFPPMHQISFSGPPQKVQMRPERYKSSPLPHPHCSPRPAQSWRLDLRTLTTSLVIEEPSQRKPPAWTILALVSASPPPPSSSLHQNHVVPPPLKPLNGCQK